MLAPFQRYLFPASLFVLLTIGALVRSQAPGDAENLNCLKKEVPDGVVRLLDSSWYPTLLPGTAVFFPSAGWSQAPEGSWSGSGTFCFRTLRSCTSTTNWLFTQYINKPADVSYPLRITVQIEGDSDADPPLSLYYYPSNGPVENDERLNTDNYISIGMASFGQSAQTRSLTFSLAGEYDRFYIAIVEENSCFTLRRLLVSYHLCQADPVGLVIHPSTPVGASAVSTSASCVANAEASPGSSLSITCNTDGTYSGSPSCSCVDEYILSGEGCVECEGLSLRLYNQMTNIENGRNVFSGLLEVCAQGSFLQVCVDATTSAELAETACLNLGYDGAHTVVVHHVGTSEPSPVITSVSCSSPTSLESCVLETGATCATMEVFELRCYTTIPTITPSTPTPSDTPSTPTPSYTTTPTPEDISPLLRLVNQGTIDSGEETYGILEVSVEGDYLTVCGGASTDLGLANTVCLALGFGELTDIEVVSYDNPSSIVVNSVTCPSSVSLENCAVSTAATCDDGNYLQIQCLTAPSTTPTPDPTAPSPVEVTGPFIAWGPPQTVQGDIVGYQVQVSSATGSTVTVEKGSMEFYHLLEREDVPSDLGGSTLITIQVRALTTQGSGEWSAEQFVPVTVLTISDLIPNLLDPEPSIMFVDDTPALSGNDAEIHLDTNYEVSSLECRLDTQVDMHSPFEDCSSKVITYPNLPIGTYKFYARAKVLSDGPIITLIRKFRSDHDSQCSVHLINNGLTMTSNSITVEYAFTGDYTRYILDRDEFKDSTSPLQLTNLSPGEHFLKIVSQPCLVEFRYPLRLNFTIS